MDESLPDFQKSVNHLMSVIKWWEAQLLIDMVIHERQMI